jgi:flavin reductase (DIM6/NTAB) family NADH-FMN oxidoreductase RutF
MKKVKFGPDNLIYPMPAILVGAVVDNKPNFITIAWSGIACSNPPMITVGMRPARHTLKGIMDNQVFSVNVPSLKLVKEVDYCGLFSGKKTDKSEVFNVFYNENKNIPLIEECPVNMECRLVHTKELGTHILVVGEITESHVSENCITDGFPDAEKIDPVIYVTHQRYYYGLGKKNEKAFSIGKDYIK